MAFGDIRGSKTGNATSVTASNACATGTNIVVVVGDLIVAAFAEQAAMTVSACTDNLGNTYTALGAGADAGTVTGRGFYTRVTVAGSISQLTFTATASSNNYACAASVFEGPFAVNPLDAQPAVILNDNTTPYTCPATGTLAQADEKIVNVIVHNGNPLFTATAPNISAIQIATASVLRLGIGHQTVTSTASVTPAWTSSATPTASGYNTVSFKRAYVNYTLTGTTRTFALGGNNTTLLRQCTLTADPGAFTLTGNDAALRQDYTLTAEPGAFTLTGSDATLTYTPPVGPTPTTLDPAYTATKYTLDSSKTTASYTSGSGQASTLSYPSTGTKVYAEVRYASGGVAYSVGVTNSTYPFESGALLGSGTPSVGYANSSAIYCDGALSSVLVTIAPGDRIAVAADITTQQILFRNITKASAWSTPATTSMASGTPLRLGFSAAEIGGNATFIFDYIFAGVPPDGSYTRWNGTPAMYLDPGKKAPSLTLSNLNLTATKNGTEIDSTVLSTPSNGTRLYAEALIVAGASSMFEACGIANNTFATIDNNWLGQPGGNSSIGYHSDGKVWRTGTTLATLTAITDGQTVAVDVDITAQTIKFRNVTAGSAWSTAFSIASQLNGGPIHFGVTHYSSIGKSTVNFLGPFIGEVPAGCTRWDGSAVASSVTHHTLTCSPGTFALTGNNATLTYEGLTHYTLTATAGSFAMYGSNISLTYTPTGPPASDVTLDPAITSSRFTLSDGNLTATYTGASGYGTSGSTFSSGTSRMYAEFVATSGGHAGNTGYGVSADMSGFEGGWLGASGSNVALYGDGAIYRNSGVAGTGPTFLAGQRIAIDVSNNPPSISFRNVTSDSAWSTPVTFTAANGSPLSLGISAQNVGSKGSFFFDTVVGDVPASCTQLNGSPFTKFNLTASYTPSNRNNFDGWVGVAFVATRNETVTKLGLRCGLNNTGNKTAYLYEVISGTIASPVRRTAVINMTGGSEGRYYYASITPFELEAGKNYFLSSFVASGGDWWGDGAGCKLGSLATTVQGAYSYDQVALGTTGNNYMFYGVDLIFEQGGVPEVTHYTLTGNPGAFLHTGAAATLYRNVPLQATAGSFTLTGNNANLVRGYPLTATPPGAFSLTGNPATLTRSVTLTATAGAFALTGSNATLALNRSIAAAPGAFALTGVNVTMQPAWRITASTGAFNLTGSPVDMVTVGARALIAQPGSFEMAGNTVSMTVVRSLQLTATTGAFALTGNSAGMNLVRAYALTVAPGAFTMTGNDAGLNVGLRITAGAGSFVMSTFPAGMNAGVVAAYRLEAQPGAFLLTGPMTTIELRRRIVALGTPFIMSGRPVDMIRTEMKRLTVEPGAFLLTGQPVDLVYRERRDLMMTVEPGLFELAGNAANMIIEKPEPPIYLPTFPGDIKYGRRVTLKRW